MKQAKKRASQDVFKNVNRVWHNQKGMTLPVIINGVLFQIGPDSGSYVNLMGQQHIKRLSNVELERTNFQDRIQSITEDEIPIAGKFQGDIASKSMTVTDTFYVLKENMKGPPILSENTLLTLEVIKYDPEGGFHVKATTKVPMEIDDLKKQFPEVFNGL